MATVKSVGMDTHGKWTQKRGKKHADLLSETVGVTTGDDVDTVGAGSPSPTFPTRIAPGAQHSQKIPRLKTRSIKRKIACRTVGR
jgi:hypothetical protein